MQNLALKFAWLSVRASRELGDGEKPRAEAFLDLTPEQMFRRYKAGLTLEQRAALQFGFSEAALLAILNAEFEIDVARGLLLFKRQSLNARSLFLANLVDYLPAGSSDPSSLAFLDSVSRLTERLWQATRHLYEADLPPERERELCSEIQECARQYLSRQNSRAVEQVAATVDLRRLGFSLTAEALFKGDAAAALFGPESGYAQAWKRKQIFRQMQAQRLKA